MQFVIRYEAYEVIFSKFDTFLEAYSLLKDLCVPRIDCGFYDSHTLEYQSFITFPEV